MTACVAVAPDSRMDSSSTCVENLHGCMSDDLDTSFRPAVGLLKKVDVISAYMTAAAEMAAEREEGVCANTSASRNSAQIESEDKVPGGTTSCSEKSEEFFSSSFNERNVSAECENQPLDLVKRDDEEEPHASVTSPRMELKAAAVQPAAHVVEAGSDSSGQKRTEENERFVSTDNAVELKQAGIEDQTKVGDLAKHAIAEVSDVENPAKEEAEVAVAKSEDEKLAEGVHIAKNVKGRADEVKYKVRDRAVTSEENIDRNEDTVVETQNPRMHAHSDAVTAKSTSNLVTDLTEELTVPDSSTISALPADTEDAVKETDENLTESMASLAKKYPFQFTGLNHVAFCCESLERSLDFYCGLLGLKTNLDRPDLPYRGAWLLLGAEGIHIMEVPNPDPVKGRPPHGGYDRHACLNVKNVDHLKMIFDKAGINYQLSMVPSIFCRDPDGNGLEFIEVEGVHVD